MYKNVECTFGILKGRFRNLKAGVHVSACDEIWLACCALHNLLLEVDRLEDGWVTLNFSWFRKVGGTL